jgi:hypothetical protein
MCCEVENWRAERFILKVNRPFEVSRLLMPSLSQHSAAPAVGGLLRAGPSRVHHRCCGGQARPRNLGLAEMMGGSVQRMTTAVLLAFEELGAW